MGEAFLVDQALLVQLMEVLDGLFVWFCDCGIDDFIILDNQVVESIKLSKAPKQGEQSIFLSIVEEREGNLIIRSSISIHVVVLECSQHCFKLCKGGGNAQAQFVQPSLVDEQLVMGDR
ncbi:hypothetical protein SDC9_105666 [bioreactor metagenome]|uniref:Uncharacterized protein n=1 Tax=bioreactor metagenome TaxID=1076179 RepID=A0A645B6Q8_9ZZZZ